MHTHIRIGKSVASCGQDRSTMSFYQELKEQKKEKDNKKIMKEEAKPKNGGEKKSPGLGLNNLFSLGTCTLTTNPLWFLKGFKK